MHQFKTILIPTDFSQAAWSAVKLGLSMADPEGSVITLFHVYPYHPKFRGSDSDMSDTDIQAIQNIKKKMIHFCKEMENGKVKLNPMIIGGEVDAEILTLIAKQKFDLVIMGVNSSGLDNQPGTYLTSVIEKSSAPVLIMPNMQTDKIPV